MTTQSIEETFVPLPLEALTYFELDNGAYCFVGNIDDICKHVDALGIQIYYVLTTGKFTEVKGNVTSTVTRPAVFKIVNNLVGRAVVCADDDFDMDTISPQAWFSLPKIPYTIVKKMDDFFRTIHDMYGTESIVILTYDPNYTTTENPSNGWGVLVPEQENTAGNCDYVADSIVESKDDHVIIVGSAHSHPNMSAFASGTDHKDQANFDGLHITYGWMKSKDGGATEFHIELQMGGTSFTLTPDQVFGDIPLTAPDEEIKSWTEKVKKKSYGTGGNTSGPKHLGSQGSAYTPATYSSVADRWKVNLPAGHPDIKTNILVGVLNDAKEEDCPFCLQALLPQDLNKRRCLACHNYLALPGETLDDIMRVRVAEKVYSYELEYDKNPPKAIYYWVRDPNQVNPFIKVYDPKDGLVGDLGK